MNIKIIGDIASTSGYSSHTVQLARALKAEGVNVKIECALPKDYEWFMPKDLREMVECKQESDAVIFIGLPLYWKQVLSERPKKFFGYFIWECEDIPEYLVEVLNDERVTGILTPSSYCQLILEKHSVTRPIHVVPHGVNPELFKPEVSENKSDRFTILFNKGWSKGVLDRSGFDLLLKAFSEEFSKEDNVLLIAKINTCYNHASWNIHEEISKLGVNLTDSPEVRIVLETVNIEQLYKFYNLGDVFCVPSKGEAFGLTFLESMACKVPCIATSYGGQLDFVNEHNGWLINHELIPATDGLLTEGCRWASPDVIDLRNKLRLAFNEWRNEKTLFEVKRRLAFETAKMFTWQESAKKLLKII